MQFTLKRRKQIQFKFKESTHTKNNLSPVHYQILSLFDCIQHKIHRYGMDNIYMPLKFACFDFKLEKKVLVVSIHFKGHCGLTACALQ